MSKNRRSQITLGNLIANTYDRVSLAKPVTRVEATRQVAEILHRQLSNSPDLFDMLFPSEGVNA
jgi:hypothetical protein